MNKLPFVLLSGHHDKKSIKLYLNVFTVGFHNIGKRYKTLMREGYVKMIERDY